MGNIGEDLKKVLMAGIGAAVLTAEKSKDLIEKLVEKGELTAAQGKELVDKLVEKGMMTAEQGKVLAMKLADAAEEAARKGKKLFDMLVERGEESVRQGRERNEELKRSMQEKKKEKVLADILDSLNQLDPEAREAIKRKLAEMQANAAPGADAAAEKEEKA
jgi:polyhydroxyalkanoate synthesis regulator phasin